MSEESAVSALTALLVQLNEQHADDMREIRDRLAKGDDRMTGIETTLGEVKTIGIETRAETRRTNGRVSALEEWQRMRQKALAAEEDFQRGRRAQRADDLEKLDRARSLIEDWWPVGLALVVGAGAVWAYVSWPV